MYLFHYVYVCVIELKAFIKLNERMYAYRTKRNVLQYTGKAIFNIKKKKLNLHPINYARHIYYKVQIIQHTHTHTQK